MISSSYLHLICKFTHKFTLHISLHTRKRMLPKFFSTIYCLVLLFLVFKAIIRFSKEGPMSDHNKHPYEDTIESIDLNRFRLLYNVFKQGDTRFIMLPSDTIAVEGRQEVSRDLIAVQAIRVEGTPENSTENWSFNIKYKDQWYPLDTSELQSGALEDFYNAYIQLDSPQGDVQ